MVLILIIVSLYNLETIDIRDSGLKMLPPSIGCLQGLVHLLIGLNMTMTLPNEIGRLTNLQLLEHVTFYISGNLLDQLKRLTNLKVLGLLLLWTQ
jgi:Leucine-rich repeat (LRR) protein